MERRSMPPQGATVRAVMRGKTLAQRMRIRRRQENATFGGAPSISEDSSERELSQTFCCTPTMPPRSDAVSTMSTMPSSVSVSSSSPRSSTCSSAVSAPLPQNLRVQGWMYWARPDAALTASGLRRRKSDPSNGECFTKVFAVLRNEFLLLYKSDNKSAVFSTAAETPLVQIAVAKATLLTSGSFLVVDPHGEEMELYLYNRQDQAALERWEDAFEQAAELTESHFLSFDVKVEDLSRSSMYRGSLYDLRLHRESFGQSVKQKLTKLKSLRPFLSAARSRYASATREVSM